jgi:hypothetical protein
MDSTVVLRKGVGACKGTIAFCIIIVNRVSTGDQETLTGELAVEWLLPRVAPHMRP